MPAFGDWFGIEWVLIILGVLVVLISLPYTLGPLLIYLTQKVSGAPELEEFALGDEEIPGAVKRYLFPTIKHAEDEGFEQLGAYYLGTLVPNVRCFLVLMGNRPARDLALLAVTYVTDLEGSRIQQRHVEFSARFDDGTVVDTNNSEEISAFRRLPDHHVVSLPWIKDVRYLYQIHQAVAEHFCPGGQKEWKVGHDPATYLEKALAEEVDRQTTTGYLYRDSRGDYRPTIKGAILMTYKNLWPFTAIQRAFRRRRGERLLSELQV